MQREYFSKCFPTRLLAQAATASPSARSIDVVFSSALTFKSHISGMSRTRYYRDMLVYLFVHLTFQLRNMQIMAQYHYFK